MDTSHLFSLVTALPRNSDGTRTEHGSGLRRSLVSACLQTGAGTPSRGLSPGQAVDAVWWAALACVGVAVPPCYTATRQTAGPPIRWQGDPYRRAARPEERKPRGCLTFRFPGGPIILAGSGNPRSEDGGRGEPSCGDVAVSAGATKLLTQPGSTLQSDCLK